VFFSRSSRWSIQVSQGKEVSTTSVATNILQEEGVLGLYRGVWSKCTETGFKNFVYFYIYDAINHMAKRQVKLGTRSKLFLGYAAGVINVAITMPLEVLSTRLQVESGEEGMASLTMRILEKEGARSLYRGFGFNVILAINPAIQNTCFDRLKEALLKAKRHSTLSPAEAFTLGAVAKALATVLTFPLVRRKTILQTRASNKEEEESEPLRLRELFRGLGSALVKSVLQAALLYMTKDQVEQVVVRLFRVTSEVLRRKGGSVKLGAFSGRPLAS